jgi:transposase-like protein
MSEKEPRQFTPAFKAQVVARMEAGANVSALSRELGIKRTLLNRWRDAVRRHGPVALRVRGRPRKDGLPPATPPPSATAPPAGSRSAGENEAATALATARSRIAALEQKIGQQQLELDFFRQALRQVEALSQAGDKPGAAASTPSSRRGRSRKAD